MSAVDLTLAAVAAFAAGIVNALAGGGTLISFPVLVALGLPPVSANVTNTVALCPGYLGGAYAQRGALAGQRTRVLRMGLAAAVGGLVGSVLLVLTSDDAFRVMIPGLVLAATLLLAGQDRIRRALGIGAAPADDAARRPDPVWLVAPILAVSVYGGFFGAGLGIMLLAVMGIVLHERLDRLNALKQVLSLIINVTASAFFLTSGKVDWPFAAVMAVGSLAGGSTGGRLAGRVKPSSLRAIVVVVGLVVSVVYGYRTWL